MKLNESLTAEWPGLTPRDAALPDSAGLVVVTGVRRGGKTSFLAQCRADRVAEGRPRESQLLVSLDDERLTGLSVEDLAWLVDEHGRLYPGLAQEGGTTIYLDGVDLLPNWERLVSFLGDARALAIVVAGSHRSLLNAARSAGVRGTIAHVPVAPFSFREVLRHQGAEPAVGYSQLSGADRAWLDQRLRRYLAEGGFPGATGAPPRERADLLRGYVDTILLREIVERHRVSSPQALRWMVRELLCRPGGAFSVNKQYEALRALGVPVGKDALHEYLAYLEDACLIRTVCMHSASSRQRMVNPRLAYPVDPGLIGVFARTSRAQRGRGLEAVVLHELERWGWSAEYVRTAEIEQVTFLGRRDGESPLLLQVCAETEGDSTWDGAVAVLAEARASFPEARALILTLDAVAPVNPLPAGLEWASAAAWLLEG
ncbi:MAG: ATP-binding protein [Chloroflexota bacterium]